MPEMDPARPIASFSFPDALAAAERERIRARRAAAGEAAAGGPVAGLALSGGGIRSATFALGLLQSFARNGLLQRFDYLSTVSGGGYVGSALGALYARARLPGWAPANAAAGPVPRAQQVASVLSNRQSDLLGWLRENGRYMSPNGAGDLLLAAASMLRNWLAVHAVLATAVLGASTLLVLLRYQLAAWLAGGTVAGFDLARWLAVGAVSGSLWWSPWIALPLAIFVLAALPAGAAYWLVPVRATGLRRFFTPLCALALLAVEALAWRGAQLGFLAAPPLSAELAKDLAVDRWLAGALIVTGLSLGFLVAGAAVARWKQQRAIAAAPDETERKLLERAPKRVIAQHHLTLWLKTALVLCAATLAIGVVDSLAQSAYWLVRSGDAGLGTGLGLTTLFGGAGALVVTLRKLLAFVPSLSGERRPRISLSVVALVAALVLALALLTLVGAMAHALAWRGGLVSLDAWGSAGWAGADGVPWLAGLYGATLALLVANVALARTWSFLNQSTHAPMYGARLRRAYLGASNPRRFTDGTAGVNLEDPGDDLAFDDYRPDERGGPLHLINVTVNETVEGRSQIEQRDRKGTSLCFGPAGLSLGVRHHARWESPSCLAPVAPASGFRVFEPDPKGNATNGSTISPEPLSVGRLAAISGAAVSTGIGSRTSLGLSVLLGLLNLRLGHWWKSGVDPRSRPEQAKPTTALGWFGARVARWFSVQQHLVDEILARFPGTARRHWYLTDGGHFENTGCYELLRRRLPLIVCADAGQDAAYQLDDLGQLVRKARLDLGADIRFLEHTAVDRLGIGPARTCFGVLDALGGEVRPDGIRRCRAHAAIAEVRYHDDAGKPIDGVRSWLIWIKPGLRGDEPRDVIEYQLRNPDFPQQSTADQFFDEAQWESYRALGEEIGETLFPRAADGGPHRWLFELPSRA